MKQNKNMLKTACMFGLACMVATSTVNATTVTSFAEDTTWVEAQNVRHVKLMGDGNGQITLDGKDGDLTNLKDGETYTYTITPNEGYELDKVELNGTDVTEYVKDGKLAYMLTWEDQTFRAYFKQTVSETPERRVVKLHNDGNGQITLDGRDGDLTDLEDGMTYTFTITPNEGYELDRVVEASAGDVTEYVKDGVLSYKIPWNDLDFTAYFKPIAAETERRVVKLHSDGNGQITLDGKDGDIVGLEDGKIYNFVITPNKGYELDKVVEAHAGDVTEYVKDGVLSYKVPWDDLDFTATFKKVASEPAKDQYKFGLRSDENGLLTYGTEDGDHFFKDGTYTFTVKANDGYELDKIYNQDGVDVTEDIALDENGNFEWRVTYDGYLTATFKEVKHHEGWKFGLCNDGNGLLTYGTEDGDHFFKEGTYTFTVKANEGYELDKIYNQDGVDVTADVKLDENGNFEWRVAYDGYLKATFKEAAKPEEPTHEGWRWGLQSDGNGVIRCEELGYDGGEKFVEEGEYTFQIIPNEGYELDKLYLITEGTEADVTEDAEIADDGTFTWTAAYDGTLKATFKEVETQWNGWRWGLQSDGNGVIRCEELGYDGGEKFVEEAEYTFQVIANDGYEFDKLYLITEDGNMVDVTEDAEIAADGTFTWTVAYDGALKATFKEAAAPVDPVTPVDPTKPEDPAKPEDTTKKDNTSTDKKTKKDKKKESKEESKTPKTGDTAPIAATAGVSVAALAAAAVVVSRRKTEE